MIVYLIVGLVVLLVVGVARMIHDDAPDPEGFMF